VKGEEELQDGTEQEYGFIDESLEEEVNTSEFQQETDMVIGLQTITYIQVLV
jgi:hypothetical protein